MRSVLVLAAVVSSASPAQKTVVIARPRPSLPIAGPPVTLPADSMAPVAPKIRAPQRRVPMASRFRRLQLQSFVLSRFDDNVNRDTARIPSVGVISGAGAQLISDPVRPWFTGEYDVAMHRYTATERFNRVSQRGRIALSARAARWWTIELVGEGALKGSFEDRDVSDQLAVQPRTELRLGSARRIRFTGSHRWRRYPASPDQDAVNRYAAVEFRHRLTEGSAWETEFRVERNAAITPRFDYRRTTWNSVYTTPLGSRATLELEMQYRLQVYPGRSVEIEDEDVVRRDHRLQPAAAFTWHLGRLDLEVSYEPEWRRSNDPSRSIDQHVLLFGVRQRWW